MTAVALSRPARVESHEGQLRARNGAGFKLRWNDGIYVPDDGDDPAVEIMIYAATDKLFLELLAVFTAGGCNSRG